MIRPLPIILGFALAGIAGKAANLTLSLLTPAPNTHGAGVSTPASAAVDAGDSVGLSGMVSAEIAEQGFLAAEVAGACLHETPDEPDHLLAAIEQVESGGSADAVGDEGRAVGILQIHRIMVDDCRRIAPGERFTYADRLSPERSRAMFRVFVAHYCKGYTNEQVARCWNGGPMGDRKPSTAPYWAKVQEAMK